MRSMLSSQARKAYMAGIVAAIAFAAPAVDDGTSVQDVLGIIAAFLVAFQGVYWTENEPS